MARVINSKNVFGFTQKKSVAEKVFRNDDAIDTKFVAHAGELEELPSRASLKELKLTFGVRILSAVARPSKLGNEPGDIDVDCHCMTETFHVPYDMTAMTASKNLKSPLNVLSGEARNQLNKILKQAAFMSSTSLTGIELAILVIHEQESAFRELNELLAEFREVSEVHEVAEFREVTEL